MLRRLRLGELTALAGAGLIIASLALPWYRGARLASGAGASASLSAWATFGPAVAFLIIGCAGAIGLALANLFERSTSVPVAAAVWGTIFGLAASVSAIVRVIERPHGSSGLETAGWLALAGAVAIFLGSVRSMRDERQELYEPASPQPMTLPEQGGGHDLPGGGKEAQGQRQGERLSRSGGAALSEGADED